VLTPPSRPGQFWQRPGTRTRSAPRTQHPAQPWSRRDWRLPGQHLPPAVWGVVGLQVAGLIALPATAGWIAPALFVLSLPLVVRVARRARALAGGAGTRATGIADPSSPSWATAVGGPCDGLSWALAPGCRLQRTLWLYTAAGVRCRYRLVERTAPEQSRSGSPKPATHHVYRFTPDSHR
jgi:hypothetical protein